MSHVTSMNESCHTNDWVMSHIWMRHVTHVDDHPYVLSFHLLLQLCHTRECVMQYLWMSHVTRVNESCHMYAWVMSHIRMSLVTHMNKSCHIHEWPPMCDLLPPVVKFWSHTWMCHVNPMHESCHNYEWVVSHVQMMHVTHMNESCHTYEWVMSHIWMSHVTHITSHVTHVKDHPWLIHMCDMPHLLLHAVTHMNESCHTYEWVMAQVQTRHVTHMNESWHTYECVISHTWMTTHLTSPSSQLGLLGRLIHMCAMTHSYMRHDSFTCVTWLIHPNDHPLDLSFLAIIAHMWRGLGTHMIELCHAYGCVMPHKWMRHVTRTNGSCRTREYVIKRCSVETVTNIMGRVMSHIWMRHVTHMNTSCHIHAKRLCNTLYVLFAL